MPKQTTKIISLFNHKGGVSKTTTVFHLGWKMARLGQKVLIVDADPQCNLTGLTLGLEDYDSLFKFYDSKQNTDIFNSLAPIFAIDSVGAVASLSTSITETRNENLFVLAGNIRFSEIDTQIATALTSSGTIPILRTFVGAFHNLIKRISKEHDIDIVLIDMSPSVSATNQCILMSSDYFIIPLSPDFYCYQAIDSLSNVLPKWAVDVHTFKGKGDYSLPETPPKMLGFITQNYRIYTVNNDEAEDLEQKQMAKAYSEWLDKIKAVTGATLVPALRKAKMIVDESVFREAVSYDSPYNLAGIQNFSGLIPVSQKLSKPIYELTETDGNWSGARWLRKDKNEKEHGIKINIAEANKVYTNLANSVLKMIND
jgi:chromosome partitioning protein